MISEVIKKMRKSSGMNQKELASMVGIALTTLSGYETNYIEPSFTMVSKIADACEYDVIFKDRNSNEEIDYDNSKTDGNIHM